MKKNIGELDIEFDNEMVGVYVVIDTTTNIEVAPIFQCPNDVVAIDAFEKFLEAQKEKRAPYSKYKLRSVGMYNIITHQFETGEHYDIISDDEDIKSYIKEIVSLIPNDEGDE